MRKLSYFLILTAFIAMISCSEQKRIKYPVTQKVDTVDVYFGVEVPDPYRWLEDDNSEETAEWVKAENEITFDYLEKIPFRDKINKRLTKIWNYPRYGVPFKEGKNYFFFKNDGMQNQSVLYIREGLDDEPRVLLDPNKFSEDGTVALSNLSVSHDGKLLAYGVSTGGSDWSEIFILNIETGEKLDDHIKWVKFSIIAWKDYGFYYSTYDPPEEGEELSDKNEYHKVYYHKIGTLQKDDKLIFENKKYPLRNYVAYITEDEKYLFISESETTSGNALYYKNLAIPGSKFKQIAEGFDNEYHVIDHIGDNFLMITNYEAPKQQLVLLNPQKPEAKNWKIIIPEKDEVLGSVDYVGGKLVVEYMKDAYSQAFVYDLEGNLLNDMNLPGIGTMFGFNGKEDEDVAFYGFTSFTFPSTIYKYDVKNNESEVYHKSEIDFNPDEYTTKQVFYESKDETKVPMFIVHKKGIKMNGNNPTILYAYGGFNISMTPGFSVSRLIFLENGGIYVVANIRGGGEYGEDWHEAGIKLQKQNVFDDFIAAAEYLIKEKYTSSEKLGILGGSNGGLLIGACMNQRPELFKVAVPIVGVMDMLRYHKFTIGWAWAGDYGTSEENKEMFEYLLGYSPLHNIKKGLNYPATLAITADHDDRVVPLHSFKYMATLQEMNSGKNPVLIRIETMAGHGAGKPTSKIIEESTDIYSFIMYNLGMKPM